MAHPKTCHTFRFDSGCGFAYTLQRLPPLTYYSVSRQWCHSCVPAFAYHSSNGILTISSIGIAIRLILRPRLTLIRLALIRNPESFGEGVSRPLYRYLYLHLLFQTLQHTLQYAFNAGLECSPTTQLWIHSFGNMLMPDYYPRFATRLVSCYALFK